MSNEKQETIADIVSEMLEFAETDSQTIGRDVLRRRIQHFARRFEAAAKREVAELKSKMNDVVCENNALRDACGTCGAKREVAELRECLKEAIREKCPFTRMSCKHGEPCDYECGTVKWRKAIGEKGGEE